MRPSANATAVPAIAARRFHFTPKNRRIGQNPNSGRTRGNSFVQGLADVVLREMEAVWVTPKSPASVSSILIALQLGFYGLSWSMFPGIY